MKILVCGLPGSGKTWLAERLQKNIKNCAWYNADFVRKYSNDWDFEVEGRVVCESPALEYDALLMQKEYRKLNGS